MRISLSKSSNSATVDPLSSSHAAPQTTDTRNEYIRQLADEIGECFSAEDHPDALRPIAFAQVPQHVRHAANARVAQLSENLAREGGEEDGADVSDDDHYEILRATEVVGYVVQVVYFVDNPLFDGGGTTLYIDTLGEIVEEVEWWG